VVRRSVSERKPSTSEPADHLLGVRTEPEVVVGSGGRLDGATAEPAGERLEPATGIDRERERKIETGHIVM
jgi:hypothetical protein